MFHIPSRRLATHVVQRRKVEAREVEGKMACRLHSAAPWTQLVSMPVDKN